MEMGGLKIEVSPRDPDPVAEGKIECISREKNVECHTVSVVEDIDIRLIKMYDFIYCIRSQETNLINKCVCAIDLTLYV